VSTPEPITAARVRSYSTALYLLALVGVPLLGATISDGRVMFLFPARAIPAGCARTTPRRLSSTKPRRWSTPSNRRTPW
jgi:hypothetical protein